MNEALRRNLNDYISESELRVVFEVVRIDKGVAEIALMLYDGNDKLFYEFPSFRVEEGHTMNLKGFKIKIEDPNYIIS